MKDCDRLKQMFHDRLVDAELPVRGGLWDELQASTVLDVKPLQRGGTHSVGRWLTVAASLLLLLGLASALLWFTQPQTVESPMAEADPDGGSSQVQSQLTASSESGGAGTLLPVRTMVPDAGSFPDAQRGADAAVSLAGLSSDAGEPLSEENGEEMVHVQVTIRIQEQGFIPYANAARQAAAAHQGTATEQRVATERKEPVSSSHSSWALKAGIGSSLAKGDAHTPFTASLTAERKLSKWLAVEAGVQYHCLPHRGTTYHSLSIPARLQCLLAASDRLELYALAGGQAEKCVAGAPSNSFSSEPVRLAVEGGVGMRYRLSDRLALFAEPTVTHHFSTDSANSSLRTERPTNFNLLCGLRVNY